MITYLPKSRHKFCRYASPEHRQEGPHKHLAIGLVNGLMQLMSSAYDQQPVVVDTLLYIAKAKWNPDGTMLAVAGALRHAADGMDANVVKFYACSGSLLHQTALPGGRQIAGASTCSCAETDLLEPIVFVYATCISDQWVATTYACFGRASKIKCP